MALPNYYPLEAAPAAPMGGGAPMSPLGTETLTLTYNASTGEVVAQNDGSSVAALFLDSAAGRFTDVGAKKWIADFVEIDSELWGVVSFSRVLADGSLGTILPTGLTLAQLNADLSVLEIDPTTVTVTWAYDAGAAPMQGEMLEGGEWLTDLAMSQTANETGTVDPYEAAIDLIMAG